MNVSVLFSAAVFSAFTDSLFFILINFSLFFHTDFFLLFNLQETLHIFHDSLLYSPHSSFTFTIFIKT
ncbi:hypothetical protein I7I48_00057 [Histoplasma ohiense]|nr:hypothetical protein I7I48_00057 [Histoplasma ohiense (nom. inval.)]